MALMKDKAVTDYNETDRAKTTPIDEATFFSMRGKYATTKRVRGRKRAHELLTWAAIVDLVRNPESYRQKDDQRWMIPSSHASRELAEQIQHGRYQALWLDIDNPTPPMANGLVSALQATVGGFVTYTTASATTDRQKCRGIIPLAFPLVFDDWVAAQTELIRTMEAAGVSCDVASKKGAQILYLPTVGQLGYYDFHVEDGAPFDPMAVWGDAIQSERERIAFERAEAKQRKATAAENKRAITRSAVGASNDSLIDAFNAVVAVDDVLINAGYVQRGNTFCHPGSESGSFSATVKEGRVHALSTNDPLYTGGAGGGAHDAFSAFSVLYHGGNLSEALKDAGSKWVTIGAKSWNQVHRAAYAKRNASSRAAADFGLRGEDGDPLAIGGGVEGLHADDGEPKAEPLTDLDLSRRFADDAAGFLRFTSGLDWMVKEDRVWVPDERLMRQSCAKHVCMLAASRAAEKEDVNRVSSLSRINAAIQLSRDDGRIMTPMARWDERQDVANTPAGAFCLRTGALIEVDEALYTKITKVAPVREPAPIWEHFLTQVFDGDLEMVEFTQRLAGYLLTGLITEQKVFFLFGGGANGKSVFLDTLAAIFGSYAHNLPSSALMAHQHEQHPTVIAGLAGVRCAVSGEIADGARWDGARLKELSGNATQTARRMQKDFFEFKTTHKHIISGNLKPRLRGDDAAMARRMVLIPFMQKFEGSRRDNNLLAKLEKEHAAILQWVIDGAVKWFESGLQIPAVVTEATNEYMQTNNSFDEWITERCDRVTGHFEGMKDLYGSYRAFKQERGEQPESIIGFAESLVRIGFEKRRLASGMQLRGLRLRGGFESPTDSGEAAYRAAKGY